MTRARNILVWIHIPLFILMVLNLAATIILNFSFYETIEFGVKLILAVSGLALFFFYINPFRIAALYFGIYTTAFILLIIGLILRGMLGLLIFSILAFALYPDQKTYENDGLIIGSYFHGFMAPCCEYKFKERKYWIFERELGVFESEGEIDFTTLTINRTKDEFVLSYSIKGTDALQQVERIAL